MHRRVCILQAMNEPVKRNWLRVFSPCILAALFSVVVIIMGLLKNKESDGWSMLFVALFVPFLVIMLLVDYQVKKSLKNDVLFLWLAEIGIIGCILIIFNWIQ